MWFIILSEFAMDERSRWFREPGRPKVKFKISKSKPKQFQVEVKIKTSKNTKTNREPFFYKNPYKKNYWRVNISAAPQDRVHSETSSEVSLASYHLISTSYCCISSSYLIIFINGIICLLDNLYLLCSNCISAQIPQPTSNF